MLKIAFVISAAMATCPALAADDVSVDVGKRISIVGGCHDCHTVSYNESNGQIDPATALKGSTLGYQGPWGTTFPANLRVIAAGKTEDEWVEYLSTFEAKPPMPWYNVHAFTEAEARSLYQYIKSLGDPGDAAPEALPPGEAPKTPFVVMAPPNMPAS